MDKKIAKRWVKALRSGEYRQGIGQLRDRNDQFCCMGVLCNIHAYDHPKIAARQITREGYMGVNGMPPSQVRDWASMRGNSLETLAELNDTSKWSFKKIADYIEANWKKI